MTWHSLHPHAIAIAIAKGAQRFAFKKLQVQHENE